LIVSQTNHSINYIILNSSKTDR